MHQLTHCKGILFTNTGIKRKVKAPEVSLLLLWAQLTTALGLLPKKEKEKKDHSINNTEVIFFNNKEQKNSCKRKHDNDYSYSCWFHILSVKLCISK